MELSKRTRILFSIHRIIDFKLFLSILLLLLFLVSCKYENNYDKGINALKEYNYQEAIDYLKKSLDEEDDYIDKEDKYLSLVKAYLNNEEYRMAARYIFRSIEETKGNKINEFIDQLKVGYDLYNEEGINNKSIIVNIKNNFYDGEKKDVGTQFYARFTSRWSMYFPNYKKQNPNSLHSELMVLEIDKINDNHRFITHDCVECVMRVHSDYAAIGDESLYVDVYAHVSNDVTLNYQNGKVNSFEVRIPAGCNFYSSYRLDTDDNNFIPGCNEISPIIKEYQIYNGKFQITRYYYEENIYPYVEKINNYEAFYSYNDNGALISFSDRILQFANLVDLEKLENGQLSIDDINGRNEYISDIRREIALSDDGRILYLKEYSSDKLRLITELTYDNDNKLIHFIQNTLFFYPGWSEWLDPYWEFSYFYNDDGYLIRENIIDGDGFTRAGDCFTLEYNDDYSEVTIYKDPPEPDFYPEKIIIK